MTVIKSKNNGLIKIKMIGKIQEGYSRYGTHRNNYLKVNEKYL